MCAPKLIRWKTAATRLSPAWVAFLGSMLLSLIAMQRGTINRDGMLYVDAARAFIEHGFNAANVVFPWPFLPILMALIAQTTGLDLAGSGYLLNMLFMAGASALLIACASRMFPEAVWHIALVVLALPGFNAYRDELLREYGCWFFVMLSFWLALRWADAPRWPMLLAAQAALVLAALFRPEALAFFPALILWQLFAAQPGERLLRALQIGGLPLLGLTALLMLYVMGNLIPDRLAGDLGRLNLERFDAKALAIAPALIEYARDQAHFILFFGSLAIVPVKFFVKMGIFMLPLLYAFAGQPVTALLRRSSLFAWAFLAHFLVLCIFVLDLQFLAGRYAALLLAFAAPLTGYGLWRLSRRFTRWAIPMVAVSLLVMIGNVTTTGPAKQHYIEAGAWLAKNVTESPRVYVESGRSAYYAGWRYAPYRSPMARGQLKDAVAAGKYDMVILEVSKKEPDIDAWLHSAGLVEIGHFDNPNGDSVRIAVPLHAAKGQVENSRQH